MSLQEGASSLWADATRLPRAGPRIARTFANIQARLDGLEQFAAAPAGLVDSLFPESEERAPQAIRELLTSVIGGDPGVSVRELIACLQTHDWASEPSEEESDAIRVMTMHSAKGLEAPIVIIPGLEDDLLPGTADPEGVREVRRLVYVSLTRAQETLVLTHCTYRTGPGAYLGTGGGVPQKARSGFLGEMGLPRSTFGDDDITARFADHGRF